MTGKKRLLLLLPAVALILAGLLLWPHGEEEEEDIPDDGRLYVNGAAYYPKTLDTLLFIGVDSAEKAEEGVGHNEMHADFLALLVMDHTEKTYRVVQMNRDTMCEVSVLDAAGNRVDSLMAQLAYAHTYGSGGKDSCLNTVNTVSRLLYGAEILHYAAIPVTAVGRVNDAVGGVEVPVEDDFSNTDPTLVQGTRVRLTGEQAEHFIRARGSMADSTNLRRMERQKEYMEGFLQAQRMAEGTAYIRDLMDALGEELVTDLTAGKAAALAEACREYEFAGLTTLPGEARDGERYVEFVLDDAALRQLVLDIFYRPVTARSIA